MKKNMGTIDRIVRVLIAVTVAVLYWQGIIGEITAIILGAAAVIFFLTSVVSFCPIYAVIGASTCKVPEKKSS